MKALAEKTALTILTICMVVFSASITSAAVVNWIEHTIDPYVAGASRVFATDVDGDNDIDVLSTSWWNDQIIWSENDGFENFTRHVIDGAFDGAYGVYAIDLDGDTDVDILGAAVYADEIAWWENDGTENFTKHVVGTGFVEAWSVFAIDIDGDSDMDILGAARTGGEISWWENDGGQNFTKRSVDSLFAGATGIDALDLDGDGDIDVLGTALFGNEITWWENDGAENFTKQSIDANFIGAMAVHAADIDGDNDIDIAGAAWGAGEIAWWENDGSQNFTKHLAGSGFAGAYSIYAADLDGDNDVDLLGTALYIDDISWWENDGSQNFTKQTISGAFGGANSAYAIDLDGDGDIDILGAGATPGKITWWESDIAMVPCCDVEMIPDSSPVEVPAGGSFGLTGYIGNPADTSIVTDIWVGVNYLGTFYQLWSFPNTPLSPGQYSSGHLNQSIPGYAAPGTYDYVAYCGDQPTNDICDSAVFQFTVTGARVAEGYSEWLLEGDWGISEHIPVGYALYGNYPNPFNAQTSISFDLPVAGEVSLSVYNILGQRTATVVDGYLDAGRHTATWDASDYSSGIYLYKFEVGDKVFTKRMTLLK